jgi:hypothetical protein
MPRIENWSISTDNSNSFLAPELRSRYLNGQVFGHSRFKDGVNVSTSALQELDMKSKIARTHNTVYELGEPSQQYVEWLRSQGKKLE